MREMKCKPRDLAIVVDSGIEELVGLIVEVLEAACDGEHDWLTEVQGRGVLAPGINTGIVMRRTRILMLDQHLIPIRDNPVDDDIDTKDLADHDESEFRRFLNDLQSSTEKVGA
ncbi:hypothetical protein [Burkholderia gladioli]|uniref:hypothetical protein n=1 Tax=Burkholderia gladioli TaxID=28095 RepID=UPI00163EF941|nr:hypothetical protein [Burkholderia gladioli]